MKEYEYTVELIVHTSVTARNEKEAEDLAWDDLYEHLPFGADIAGASVISSDEDDYDEEDED